MRFSPKDFFLYFGLVVALYVSVVSILVLLFQYVNALFPDPLEGVYRSFNSPIRFAMSALIVAFPLLVIFTRITNGRAREEAARMNLAVRKWLLYLTLFIAGAVIAGDLIALINVFLGGELTLRFLSKVAVVLVVFGAVFTYYLKDIKEYWREHKKLSQNVGFISSAVLIAIVASGFFIIGTPATQRLVRFDERKISDLSSIQWQVVNFWQQKGRLPAELSELEDSISGFATPMDPQTDTPYGYLVKGALSFELCASFNTANTGDGNNEQIVPIQKRSLAIEQVPFGSQTWAHKTGDVCFERTIDPDLYPVREK